MADEHDHVMDMLTEVAPENVTNSQLFALLLRQNRDIYAMKQAQTETNKHILRIETNTAGMVKAWNAGGVMLDLAKWITGIALAFGAVFASMKWLAEFFTKGHG